MSAMASQIISLMIVNSTVYSGADKGEHQSSASLAFVWGIHRWPVNSPHKWPVTWKMFPFEDVIMWTYCGTVISLILLSHTFNPLWSSGAMWQHRSGSRLSQVMDSCLMTPRRYPNSFWIVIGEVLCHSHQSTFRGNAQGIYPGLEFKNYSPEITTEYHRRQWVKYLLGK